MSALPRTDRVGALECDVYSCGLVFFALALLLSLGVPPAAQAQTAPVVISVTPTNGAVDVPTNSTIVFLFDQDMNKVTPIASKPGLWVGNFEITPTNLNVSGTWAADKRTLTLKCTAGWPYLTNVTWTLNPPTNGTKTVFTQFSSVTNVLLNTVSGGFTTAAPPPPPPKIISVSPTNRAVEVPPLSPLVFTFDQDMDTNIQVVASGSNTANCGFSPTGSFSNAVWSTDKRTLTFPSLGQLHLGFVVTWNLNPAAAGSPLQNLYGEPIAIASGSFTVLTNTGGNPNEICQLTTNSTLGHYTITENLQTNVQLSANVVVPLSNSLPTFVALAKSPPGDRGSPSVEVVSNGSLTLPGGSVLVFTNDRLIVPDLGVYYTNTTDSALTSDFPPGAYVMRLSQHTGLDSTINMTVPGPPPAAMIANYDAAQAIDAGSDFILQWNSLPATGLGPFIQLAIYDSYGKLIFAAPNPCVSRTLDPSATSVLIPANTFRPGGSTAARWNLAIDFTTKLMSCRKWSATGMCFGPRRSNSKLRLQRTLRQCNRVSARRSCRPQAILCSRSMEHRAQVIPSNAQTVCSPLAAVALPLPLGPLPGASPPTAPGSDLSPTQRQTCRPFTECWATESADKYR